MPPLDHQILVDDQTKRNRILEELKSRMQLARDRNMQLNKLKSQIDEKSVTQELDWIKQRGTLQD